MMNVINFAVCDDSGVVTHAGAVQEENLPFYGVVGVNVFPISASLGDIVQDGVVVGKDIDTAKTNKKRDVNTWREQALTAPLLYGGILWDADEKSTRNVQAWVALLTTGVELPEGFVWRAYDNVDHPVTAEFIIGLAGAITARGTMVYHRAWQMKAEIDAMVNVQDVLYYRIGWTEGEI